MTAKAKCPACGDEDGSEAMRMNMFIDDGIIVNFKDWHWVCGECSARGPATRWISKSELMEVMGDVKGRA